jgi:hypothetical protein
VYTEVSALLFLSLHTNHRLSRAMQRNSSVRAVKLQYKTSVVTAVYRTESPLALELGHEPQIEQGGVEK